MSRSQRPKSMYDKSVIMNTLNYQTTGDREFGTSALAEHDQAGSVSYLQQALQQKEIRSKELLDQLEELRADKDQLEKLFEGSQIENQKCIQQITDFREHVRILEAALNRINGPSWRTDFAIPPTPGPRSSIQGAMPDSALKSAFKRNPSISLGRNSRMPFLTEEELLAPPKHFSEFYDEDSTEDVVDSMRRYADAKKPLTYGQEGKEIADRDLIRLHVERIKLDTHSQQTGSPNETKNSPAYIDLDPIITLLNTLHASSHTQSLSILSNFVQEVRVNKEGERAIDEARKTATITKLEEGQEIITKAWEDAQRADNAREERLKTMMQDAVLKLEEFTDRYPVLTFEETTDITAS